MPKSKGTSREIKVNGDDENKEIIKTRHFKCIGYDHFTSEYKIKKFFIVPGNKMMAITRDEIDNNDSSEEEEESYDNIKAFMIIENIEEEHDEKEDYEKL